MSAVLKVIGMIWVGNETQILPTAKPALQTLHHGSGVPVAAGSFSFLTELEEWNWSSSMT